MNVYMVSHGEYSDWTVDGIFSTKEKAEAFIEEKCKEEYYYKKDYSIEEVEVDYWLKYKYITVYKCQIDVPTGVIKNDQVYMDFIDPNIKGNCNSNLECNSLFLIYVMSTISQEHAHKLAIEARQKYLRLHGLDKSFT